MDREILFRGKRLQGDTWVEGYFFKSDINYRERTSGKASLIFTPDCDTFIMIPEAHNSVMVYGNTVGQFTGLTDKNGNKVFEGDIVLKRTYNGKKPFPVDFDGGMFYCGFGGGSSTPTHRYTLEDSQIEVIGNIYDNPELLEGD